MTGAASADPRGSPTLLSSLSGLRCSGRSGCGWGPRRRGRHCSAWWRRGWDWWIRGGWWACGSPRGSCGESHDMDTAPGRARADRPVPSAHWNHCAVTGQAEDSCLLCHRCPDPANQKQLTVSSSKIPGCTPWGATVLCGCTTDSIHWFFKCGDYCPSNGRETETEACERTFLKWHS